MSILLYDSVYSVSSQRLSMLLTLPSLSRRWRTVLLVAAVVLLTEGKAAAECGDYVTIRAHGQSSHQPQQLAAGSQASSVPHTTGEHPVSHQTPCHGPNCSNAPRKPTSPLAPATVATPRLKELTQSLQIAAVDIASGSAFSLDNSSSRPIHRSLSIFHPPRTTSSGV